MLANPCNNNAVTQVLDTQTLTNIFVAEFHNTFHLICVQPPAMRTQHNSVALGIIAARIVDCHIPIMSTVHKNDIRKAKTLKWVAEQQRAQHTCVYNVRSRSQLAICQTEMLNLKRLGAITTLNLKHVRRTHNATHVPERSDGRTQV